MGLIAASFYFRELDRRAMRVQLIIKQRSSRLPLLPTAVIVLVVDLPSSPAPVLRLQDP